MLHPPCYAVLNTSVISDPAWRQGTRSPHMPITKFVASRSVEVSVNSIQSVPTKSTIQSTASAKRISARIALPIAILVLSQIAIAQSAGSAASALLSVTSDGIKTGNILIDDQFAGFTPATVRLLESSKKVVIEYGEWGYETTYELDISWANGIPTVAKADVHFASDNCLGRKESDKQGARAWARAIVSSGRLPQKLTVPGFVEITHGCQFSPWFGETRFYDLTINSTPPGATVVIEGDVVGKTPLKLKIKHDFAKNRMNQLRIAASLEGFVTAAQTFIARESQTVTTISVVLQPEK
jgi:hypothetical protein